MSENLVAIILAGGAGTRFWPISTEQKPKQFLNLVGPRTLLQQSYDRIADIIPKEQILVLTNAHFVDLVRNQLPNLPEHNIIGEPMRRDTAAAIVLCALLCEKRFGPCVTAILTADHYIEPQDLFQQALLSAAYAALQNSNILYTFGIKPTYPATGYGYLRLGEQVSINAPVIHRELIEFVEKPDLKTAEQYVQSEQYFWNSGMFMWSTKAILNELHLYLPDHIEHIKKAIIHDKTNKWNDALSSAFEPLHSISIDFAVMEKAEHVRSVVANFNWSDVGGWLALKPFLDKDAHENVFRGNLHTIDSTNNLTFCENENEHVALVGVKDLVVVRAGNKTLIIHRDQTEKVKKLVQNLDPLLK